MIEAFEPSYKERECLIAPKTGISLGSAPQRPGAQRPRGAEIRGRGGTLWDCKFLTQRVSSQVCILDCILLPFVQNFQ